MVLPRKGALAEESAEVEVLFANMEKLKGLTKKIQGSMNRLENSGKSVQDAIGPIYGNTQRLQVTNSSKCSTKESAISFDRLTDNPIKTLTELLKPLIEFENRWTRGTGRIE